MADPLPFGYADGPASTGGACATIAMAKEQGLKIEIDGQGIRVVVVWKEIQEIIHALAPIIVAVAGLLAAPELGRIGHALGWW